MAKRKHNRTKHLPLCPSARLKLLGSALTFALLLLPLALPSVAAYRKPRNARPPSTATSTSGARNGSAIAPNGLQLTLLAPQQHVGLSQATHPTFEWFIPIEQSLQGEFQLYEITDHNYLSETNELNGAFQRVLETPHEFVSEQGFMTFTLPAELAGLKPNTSYIWQVLLRYGPSGSDIFMVRSQIEIVEGAVLVQSTTEASPQDQTALEQTALDQTAQIEQLSAAGLWYDALALTAQLSTSEANEQKNTLLLALANLESTDNLESDNNEVTDNEATESEEISHSEALRQIVEWQNNNVSAQSFTEISTQLRKLTANRPPT